MQTALIAPLALMGVSALAFAANEWTHGGLSEAMGLGHHHMLDYGGYHCASHNDTAHGPHHVEHMHGNASMQHGRCAGGATMHDGGGMHGPAPGGMP